MLAQDAATFLIIGNQAYLKGFLTKMSRIALHPITPERRHMQKIAEIFRSGGVLVYPTDSGYSLGCNALNPKAVAKLYNLKRAIKKYIMAMMFSRFFCDHSICQS